MFDDSTDNCSPKQDMEDQDQVQVGLNNELQKLNGPSWVFEVIHIILDRF